MNRLFLYASMAMFLSTIPAYAQYKLSHEAELKSSFKQADVIADEKIDVGEFDIYNLRIFDSLDSNVDDSLAQDECSAGCFPVFDDELSSPNMVKHYSFKAIDSDHNGLVSEAEYVFYGRSRFKEYDADESLYLNREEFYAFYEAANERTFMAKDENRSD